jgi:hypothetical protein
VVEAMTFELKAIVKRLIVIVAVMFGVPVAGHQHLRSRDTVVNQQKHSLYSSSSARGDEKDASYVDKSSLASGSLIVYTFHSNGDEKTYRYCMTYPEECELDPSSVSYKLSQCIPDPLGQVAAVKVLADTKGHAVLTSFSDTNCTIELKSIHITVGDRGSNPEKDIKYEIHTADNLSSSPVHFVKKYYFDETCRGPHSKVALGSYVQYDMRTGVCWNDPYNGQSYIATYVANDSLFYAGDDPKSQAIGTAKAELCTFDVQDCSGCDFALNSDCNAAYSCYGNVVPESLPTASLPGYNRCVKEGNHYVMSVFGGDANYKMSSSVRSPAAGRSI